MTSGRLVFILGSWLFFTGLNIALLPGRYAPHVEIEAVQRKPMPLLVRAAGNLEAKDSNTVQAQLDGPILSKKFREGQQVQKGQLLAIIARDRIRVDYQSKKDALVNAESDLAHARRDLRLQKELYKKEAVAYSTVDDAERALVKAEQGLRSAKQAMKVAQDQWNSAYVTAPISGTIIKDALGEDKFITSGKDILTIADVSEYTLHAKVDELDIRQVQEGQKATVRIQIFQNSQLPAVVTEVGSQLEGTGLPEIPVVLRLIGTGGLDLRPKLTGEARIFSGETEPILSVPLTAIVNNDGDPHVWVLSAINRMHRRSVGMGRANPDRTEILHGLSPGDRVCVTAEPDFAEGMRVVIGAPGLAEGAHSKTAKFLPPLKKDAKNPWQTQKTKF